MNLKINQIKPNKSGITLVALVITVIILLILAGAAVTIALNGDSIFGKANRAVTEWNSKVSQEEGELQNLTSTLAELSGEDAQVVSETSNGLTIIATITPDDAGTYKKVTVSVQGLETAYTQALEAAFMRGVDGGYYDMDAFLAGNNSILQGQSKTYSEFQEKMKTDTGESTYEAALNKYNSTHNVMEASNLTEAMEAAFLRSIDSGYNSWTNFLTGGNSFLQGQSKTKDEFIDLLKTRMGKDTYDEALLAYLNSKGMNAYERATISVKNNGSNINLTNKSYLVTENKSRYEITASTASGKSGAKTIEVVGIAKETFATPSSVDYSSDSKTARIPAGYYVGTSSSVNSINNGLVITSSIDSNGYSTGDEYVWIPVSDINDMVMCKSNASGSICNITQNATTGELTCSTHSTTGEENFCGRIYGESYSQDSAASTASGKNVYKTSMKFGASEMATKKASQTFNANSGYREPAIVTGNSSGTGTSYDGASNTHGLTNAAAFLGQLQGDFYAMAKSVAKYHGFWISRYEIGQNGSSKRAQTVRSAGSSSANTWYGLYRECRSEDSTNKISKTMIWGSQYDQAIRFMGSQAEIGHPDRKLENSACVSGFAPLDKMKNVYDLEGNLHEWTAEAYDTVYRVSRGSVYNNVSNGDFYPASYHNVYFPTSAITTYGSRATLYVTL